MEALEKPTWVTFEGQELEVSAVPPFCAIKGDEDVNLITASLIMKNAAPSRTNDLIHL